MAASLRLDHEPTRSGTTYAIWGHGQQQHLGVRVPAVFTRGIVAFLLRFVPYIGPFIAAAFPMALALFGSRLIFGWHFPFRDGPTAIPSLRYPQSCRP
jgi:hypothetical protein